MSITAEVLLVWGLAAACGVLAHAWWRERAERRDNLRFFAALAKGALRSRTLLDRVTALGGRLEFPKTENLEQLQEIGKLRYELSELILWYVALAKELEAACRE